MASRYKTYPEYKDSGVEWLGDVPEHWVLTKIARHYIANKGKYGQTLTKDYISQNEGKYPVYSGQTENNGVMGCINWFEFDTGTEGVLFSTTVGAKAMTLSHLKGKFSLSQNCLIIKKISNLFDTRFTYYHFQPLFTFERNLIPEHMQASFRMDDLYQYLIALPPIKEQQKIANFLDYETAKIDKLIAKQERLIELLKEKRQAVISHAVTKGLNPNVKMKDSGVEWLGEVPEHWLIPRIKQIVLTPVTDGPHETPDFLDDGVPFVSAEAISKGFIDFTKIRGYISEKQNAVYSRKYRPHFHDIYMVKSGATTGITAIVETTDTFNIWSPLAVIRCKKKYHPYFVLNFMRSREFLRAIELNWSFGTQQNIGMGVIENLHIVCPPKEEAKKIAKFLDFETAKIDKLIAKQERLIELSKERKVALISAVVTGKVDVRDWKLTIDSV